MTTTDFHADRARLADPGRRRLGAARETVRI